MTPFIHRELTSYRLTDLKPDTTYEVDIVLMPFTDKHTEMVSSHPIQIHTQAVVGQCDLATSMISGRFNVSFCIQSSLSTYKNMRLNRCFRNNTRRVWIVRAIVSLV